MKTIQTLNLLASSEDEKQKRRKRSLKRLLFDEAFRLLNRVNLSR